MYVVPAESVVMAIFISPEKIKDTSYTNIILVGFPVRG